jgi:hypothetical protein
MEVSARGHIARQRAKDPSSGRMTSVFRAADVDRYAAAGGEPGTTELAVRNGAKAAESGPPALSPAEPAPAVPWLTLDQAAACSGLPASILAAMIERKALPAIDVGIRPGGRWRISRPALDRLAETGKAAD